jgi:aminopeptidase
MIRVSKIAGGVKRVLRQNMGLRAGEALLVITDTPTVQEWRSQGIEKLEDMTLRNILARNIADIARREFPKSEVAFQTYPSTGRNSGEPSREVEESMRLFNVVLAVTTYSISHTDARESATKSGVRIASMPGVLVEMFYPRGSMTAGHNKIASETLLLTRILTHASKIKIQTLTGTDLTMNLEGRQGLADTGLYTEPGSWGNLPAGEAYLAPVEGTAEGIVIVQRGWFPNLRHNMKLLFEKGQLVRISGGGSIGEDLLELLRLGDLRDPYTLRKNLAEFGIGTNPLARRRDNILEAEKIRGTVHIAIGDNSHMGGRVKADHHQDFIVPSPTVEVDGRVLMEKGKLDARHIDSGRHIL